MTQDKIVSILAVSKQRPKTARHLTASCFGTLCTKVKHDTHGIAKPQIAAKYFTNCAKIFRT